ncbi:MAG: DEAD/DEAH box helicase [Candidatus Nanopelagicales bacterium]
MATPAQRYSAARRRSRASEHLAAFRDLYDFALDDFQIEACEALDSGRDVLVAAPTGSGKTVVGEYAIHLARATGRKAFYTTPIKALSNQKYRDLVGLYGETEVGLLTGDVSINGHAPTVVMTTEVLRNMVYEASSDLTGLGFVVLDEVHYLADRERGAVWEELIIQLPESVAIAALSATVSNVEEFGAWMATVRGDTQVVLEEHRPVPLWQQVMVNGRLYDLFTDDDQRQVNPELQRLSREGQRTPRSSGRQRPGKAGKRPRPLRTPSRIEVVDRLEVSELLPAIYFIFSRAGTEAAVSLLADSGARLTSPDERHRIAQVVTDRCSVIPEADLLAVGFSDFSDALQRGIAAHHAGMLPIFKEVVEELFQAALLKVVFATETLALGINMPARTVVLERLVKWNGQTHADITPGEYTQLTGRAGRRGIDVEGHAVVLWGPSVQPSHLAGLASTRTYPLRSSFRPTYNMAVNLVRRVGRRIAREILETSFAQYQSDQSVVGLAATIKRNEQVIAGYQESMHCHLGDFGEYATIRQELSQLEKSTSRESARLTRQHAAQSLERLAPGDVIPIPTGRRSGLAVVLDAGLDASGEPRPQVLTVDRQVRRLSATDFPAPVVVVDRIRIPQDFHPRSANSRKALSARLRELSGRDTQVRSPRVRDNANDVQIARLRARLRKHPCHGCNDRELHARWAERAAKLQRENESLNRRVNGRTNTIARQFDQVCAVLVELDYLDADGEELTVTTAGRMLGRLYTDRSLVIAQCLRNGIWQELSPPELAACVAALVFQARTDEEQVPRLPHGRVRDVLAEQVHIWASIEALETEFKVSPAPEPDLGFCWAAYQWANGKSLSAVLAGSDLPAGDFVRWCKQVIDALGQVASAAPANDPVREVAAAAADQLRRGVVDYSSEV